MPRLRFREQQVGDVRASDEQHKTNDGEQHHEPRAHVPHDFVVKRRDDHRMPVGARRVLRARALPPADQQAPELRTGLLDTHVVGEARDHVIVVPSATRVVVGIQSERYPKLDAVVVDIEPLWHDPDDRAELAVNLDPPTHDGALGAEGPCPKLVRQDHDVVAPGAVFLGGEHAAAARAHTEHVKKLRRRSPAGDPHGLVVCLKAAEADVIDRDFRKRLVPLAKLSIFGRRDPELVEAHRRELAVHHDEPVRSLVLERLQQTLFTTLKMALLAPIPSAIVKSATAV